jgi:hypothetical protein
MTLYQTGNLHQQVIVPEWNLEVIVGAGLEPFQKRRFFLSDATNEQQRNPSGVRILFEAPAQFHSIHLRHDDIADDDFNPDGAGYLKRAPTVLRHEDLVTLRLKEIALEIELHLIIIDDQDSRRIFRKLVHGDSITMEKPERDSVVSSVG